MCVSITVIIQFNCILWKTYKDPSSYSYILQLQRYQHMSVVESVCPAKQIMCTNCWWVREGDGSWFLFCHFRGKSPPRSWDFGGSAGGNNCHHVLSGSGASAGLGNGKRIFYYNDPTAPPQWVPGLNSTLLHPAGQVFLSECVGPLLIYLLFYFRLPFIYSRENNYTSSPHTVVK